MFQTPPKLLLLRNEKKEVKYNTEILENRIVWARGACVVYMVVQFVEKLKVIDRLLS